MSRKVDGREPAVDANRTAAGSTPKERMSSARNSLVCTPPFDKRWPNHDARSRTRLATQERIQEMLELLQASGRDTSGILSRSTHPPQDSRGGLRPFVITFEKPWR